MIKAIAIGLGFFCAVGVALAGALEAATDAVTQVNENTLIPFGLFTAGIGVAVGATWIVARDRNRQDMRIVRCEERLRSVEDRLAVVEHKCDSVNHKE